MRISFFLLTLPGLYVHAAPLSSKPEIRALDLKRGDVPALPFPSAQSADTCPVTGGNTYDGLEPERRKRSLHDVELSTTSLLPRTVCGQLAHGQINNFPNRIGNTAERLLTAGATYVFSWAFNEIVSAIRAWRHNADGTFTAIQETGFNQGSGTMTLNIEGANNVNVHFQVVFDDYNPYGIYDVTGEFALFQQANGDQNPP